MARNAIDAFPNAGTVRGKSRPFRQQRDPTHLLVVHPDAIPAAARAIATAVKGYRRRCGCGSYLFIDPDMRAYVIHEQHSIAQDWTRTRFRSLVGFYLPLAHQRGLDASLSGLTEDVTEHLADLARVSA